MSEILIKNVCQIMMMYLYHNFQKPASDEFQSLQKFPLSFKKNQETKMEKEYKESSWSGGKGDYCKGLLLWRY